MNKKMLPVLLVLLVASFLIAFSRNSGNDVPKSRYEKILRNVGLILEEGHYSPRKIDDEIHGARLESFYFITESYSRRLRETSLLYKELLARPFEFSKDETVIMDGDKQPFSKNADARRESWRKRVKYLVLSRYADMLDDREKYNGRKITPETDSVTAADIRKFVYKADSTLEREARDQVRRQLDRYFTTLKNHHTTDELFNSFVNAITSEMDPHTNYMGPIDTRGFNEMMSGRFYGIGAQLKEEESKIKVASLVTGGPAWKSGELGVNDEIIKIGQGAAEPVDVTGFAVTDAVKLIRGAQAGTEVRLTVRKPDGSVKVVSLKRDEIKLDDTFAKSAVINGEHKIGYIYLPEFYMDFDNPSGPRCSDDVAREIEKLKAEKVEGIIMDLRGNGGGSLPEVVKMVGLFIEDGPVVQVKSRDQQQPMQLKDRDKSVLYSGPLTVMVDEFSASASEIFAAAIQDYKRGLVLGSSSTYGKGTVQRTIPLTPTESVFNMSGKPAEDLGTIKLTIQKFYRVNGGTTQLKGVVPDIIMPNRYEFSKSREKDNTTALSWDEINQAEYRPWTSTFSTNDVVNTANQQVQTSSVFSSLRSKVEWISSRNEKAIPLNYTRYKNEQRELKDTYKALDSLFKVGTELSVINAAADSAKLSENKDKSEKNKQFLSRVKSDIYIDETVKVINNMIRLNNLAINDPSADKGKKN